MLTDPDVTEDDEDDDTDYEALVAALEDESDPDSE